MNVSVNKTLAASILVLLTHVTQAQDISLSDADLLDNTPSTLRTQPNSLEPSTRPLLPGENSMGLPVVNDGAPVPFGANLFVGGYESERFDGLNSDYLIAPGDQISVWLWGATNNQLTLTVDNQGNIFVPSVGPIQVKDVPASRVNTFVANEIKKVYTNNVSVYVNLLRSTPVAVYVTGNVQRPGQYAGLPSDSVLYFLKRAGGIDFDRGSFRKISVSREGSIIAEIDLYDFIMQGEMAKPQLKDGDTILVHPRGSVITVTQGAQNPLRFEFLDEQIPGALLSQFARPLSDISHVGITGTRANGAFSSYVDRDDFDSMQLFDGDQVIFNDDLRPNIYDINVSGSYLGPSYYTVSKGTTLHQLLAHIPVDLNISDISNIKISRRSVADQQKEQIEQSLQRLERSVFTAPVSSTGDAAIRSQETRMVMEFVERARQIEPLGMVIVADNGHVADIQLEQGDNIIIPTKSELIQIGGEVLVPQAIVFNGEATIEDYISWSGGFTERADYERVGVLRANGKLEFVFENNFSTPMANIGLRGGDQIMIFPKVDTKTLQSVKDITQIIYQIAVATNAAGL